MRSVGKGESMNARRFPRTLLEAFGCDATSSCAIERPGRVEHAADVGLAVVIGLLLAWGLFCWLAE